MSKATSPVKRKPKAKNPNAILIDHCIQLLESHNPLKTTPHTHWEEYCAKEHIKDKFIADFLKEVFFAVERQRECLDITLHGMFAAKLTGVARDDRPRLRILLVLSVFKLQQLGLDVYRDLMLSQQPVTAFAVLNFLVTNAEHNGWLSEHWTAVFAAEYVENTLLTNIRTATPELSKLITELNLLANPVRVEKDNDDSVKQKKQFTVPEPFNLTQPAVRPFPEPAYAFQTDGYKANPVPTAIYETSLKQIEEEQAERREKVKAATRKKHASAPSFNYQSQPTQATDKLKAQEDARFAEMTKPFKAQPAPKIPDAPHVNQTTTSLLRDEAKLRAKQAEEAAKLRRYKEELKDDSQYEKVKAERLAAEEAKKAQVLAQRKLDSQQSAAKAAAAHKANVVKKRREVLRVREENRKALVVKEAEKQEHIRANQAKREEVRALEGNFPAMREEMRLKKAAEVKKMMQQRKKEKILMERRRKKELEEKKQVIREIQALEKITAQRAKRPKEFDPTTTNATGYLNEMSLAELKDRITLMKIREEEWLQTKREAIIAKQKEKKQVLAALERKHARIRQQETAVAAASRIVAKKERLEISQQQEQELQVKDQAVKAKIKARRAEQTAIAIKLAKEYKARQLAVNFAMAGKVRAAKERLVEVARAERRQEVAFLKRQAKNEEWERKIRGADHVMHMKEVHQSEVETLAKRSAYDASVLAARAEAETFADKDARMKKAQAKRMLQDRERALEKVRLAKPYATKVANERVAKMKAKQHKKLSSTMPPQKSKRERQAAFKANALANTQRKQVTTPSVSVASPDHADSLQDTVKLSTLEQTMPSKTHVEVPM